ncbi:hypothetical protein [Aquimarina sp. SS2-1]|uniref:NADase-type glycan-binding domain-containing protein n=1 Tax=Aquimarina besae TaxID=3342247 RepID=UPI003670716F
MADQQDQTHPGTGEADRKEVKLTSQRKAPAYPLFSLVKNIKASSTLRSRNVSAFSYHPTNLYDKSIETAWFEGVEGDGIGEYIEMEFFTPIDIATITISNGYGKSESLFDKNGTVEELAIVTEGNRTIIKLEKVSEPQQFDLFLKNVSKMKFIIRSVYPGTKYKDTGISEISLESELYFRSNAGIAEKELLDLHKYYRSYSGGDYDNPKHKLIHRLSPDQFENFLNSEFEPPVSNADMADRLYFMTEEVLQNHSLIPVFLNVASKKNRSVFYAYASRDPYVAVAEKIWKDNPSGIPFLKKHWEEKSYERFYYILSLGDTRVIPEYLEIIKLEGIWHEACCELMPSEILIAKGDWYTSFKIQRFLNENGMTSEEDAISEFGTSVYPELSKAADSLYIRFGEYGG